MTAEIIDFARAAADRATELAVAREAGVEVREELVREVRARYLMGLRAIMQGSPNVVAVLSASYPATEAFDFLGEQGAHMVVSGTVDVYRDAVMFVLAELDELRKGGDQAYVVDTSTGEIVAPLTKEMVLVPPPYLDEQGIERPSKPVLNPEVAMGLILKSAAESQAADVRRRAAHPVTGRAYLHLTDPDRIVEIATQRLRDSGLSLDPDLEEDVVTLEFGRESEEADLQSTNPFYHRLWSYSNVLSTRVMRMAGTAGRFWIGPVRQERDGEHRWYSVLVKVRRAC